jgi:hypothetical protein
MGFLGWEYKWEKLPRNPVYINNKGAIITGVIRTHCASLMAINSYFKVKVKVVPVHTMKAYRGSRGITPLVLNHGTRWCSIPQLLYPSPGMNPPSTE